MRCCHLMVSLTGALLMLAAPSAAAGDVLVVDDDGGPGVDFTEIKWAVAAAGEGDTILVKDGDYDAFTIDGKSLVITAEVGAAVKAVDITGSHVKNLGAAQFVSLAGMVIRGGLFIDEAAGPVWLDRCEISGGDNFGAVNATNSSNVTLIECDVQGLDGYDFSFKPWGGDAIWSVNSVLHVFDSTLQGGRAICSPSDVCSGTPGGTGLLLSGGRAFVEGSTLQGGGGDPGDMGPFGICTGNPSGDGAYLGGDSPTLFVFDSQLAGGSSGSGCAGLKGQPFDVQAGALTMLPGTSRDFSITSPVREETFTTLQFGGQPGDTAWIFLGTTPTNAMIPNLSGPILISSPYLLLSIGPMERGGSLSLPAFIRPIPPALESVQLLLQAAFVDGGGAAFLSDPATLTILDEQF
jgi:hypothetical protein